MSTDITPTTNQPWICVTCGSGFAEYINGCPHCENAGIRSKVVRAEDFATFTNTEKP